MNKNIRSRKRFLHNLSKWRGSVVVVIAIIFAFVWIKGTSEKPFTPLENTLSQILVLGLGLTGSYVFGRDSTREAAMELNKLHARPAFRRLVSLNLSLKRLALTVQKERNSYKQNREITTVCDKLEMIIVEQIYTASDALEDWRDIVPEELEELYAQLEKKQATEIAE